jgi:hypothetical protein
MNRIGTVIGAVILASVLAGCAQVSKVASGEVVVRNKMAVTIDQPWNQFERSPTGDNHPTWTVDGVTVDALKFYVALADGDLIAPTPNEPKGQRALTFKSAMSQQEVLGLFEGLYARGGSTFALDRVAPHTFMGRSGFKAEWNGIRKTDNVRLKGVIWGSVQNGELYAITYTAPALAFFSKNYGAVEKIVASARVKN